MKHHEYTAALLRELAPIGTVQVDGNEEGSTLVLCAKDTYLIFVNNFGVLLTDPDLNELLELPEYAPVHAALVTKQRVVDMEAEHVD